MHNKKFHIKLTRPLKTTLVRRIFTTTNLIGSILNSRDKSGVKISSPSKTYLEESGSLEVLIC